MNDQHSATTSHADIQPTSLDRPLSQTTTSSSNSSSSQSAQEKPSSPSSTSMQSQPIDIPTATRSRRSVSPTQRSPSSLPAAKDASPKRRPHSYHSRRSSDDYRRFSGTVNHYGRHSNDWLFGGFSLRDTVRDGVDRLRQRDDKS
ncbi:hypothetical protein BDV28DRAFT_129949 [Aspergillus coremiiformis]|uniref:Uncharacterized protein n=1 Tax=Aspergillus coremiiformis TaxID=138285 RepID=A0A5N6ZFM0_9EURO|nr:hypothetical protein BDV28DRAFT_129949 [Aspergillus coremiiformis]